MNRDQLLNVIEISARRYFKCNRVEPGAVADVIMETTRFCIKTLDPNSEAYISPNWRDVLECEREYAKTSKHVVALVIQALPYSEFLQTPLWRVVASKVRFRHFSQCRKCCAKDETLQVHHLSYKRHGWELYDQSDLVCLCRPCHEATHGIETKVDSYAMVR